ncbi:MAG: zinc ribbon domain-containing protein [Lactobacillales bacterium]|nr:zinc ribbon domain-containing protein [Lactobacillales bacterium]
MFCGECGTKNETGAQFCEKCGAKLEVEETVVTHVAAPKKPMSKKTKVIIGVVVAVVVAFIGVYMYLGSLITPEKIALKYFKAYAANDADTLYEVMNVKDSKFVSKKLLKEAIKDNEDIKIANYSVEDKEISEDALSTKITITYIEDGSSKERKKEIKLLKNKDKKWLFFDNWTVDSSDLIAKDYTIYIPADTEIKIGDVTVSDKYQEDYYSSSTDKYVIPSILKGKYDVILEYKSGLKLAGEMSVSSNYGSYRGNNLKLASKTEKELTKDIKEKLELIYKSAMEDKSFDDIKGSFSEDLQSEIDYTYSSLKSNVNSEYRELTELNIKDIEITSVTVDGEELRLYAKMKYTYKLSYKDGEETKEYTSSEKTDTFYAYYEMDEKEYVMTDLSSINTYFSRY